MLTSIRKRDGRQVPFDIDKIGGAIGKAFDATGMHKGPRCAVSWPVRWRARWRSRATTCPPWRRYRTS